MKASRLVVLAAMLTCTCSATSFSQDRGFGLGVIIGEPTGISLKGWLSSKTAIDAGVAWSFYRDNAFHIHADYLLHAFDVFETRERIPLYYGIGGRIKTARRDDARFGLRLVVGIGYMFRDAPVDLFLEIAPIVDLAPATELRGNAGFGARFFFR